LTTKNKKEYFAKNPLFIYATKNLPNFWGKKILGKLLAHFDTISIFGAFLCQFLPFWKISIFMLPIVAKYCLGWIANDTPSENQKRREKTKQNTHTYLPTLTPYKVLVSTIQYLLGWVYGTLYIHPNPKVTFGHSC
jgi:hypothetical protein